MPDNWLPSVAREMRAFAEQHGLTYAATKRQLGASFEIGCFHSLLGWYERMGYVVQPENLQRGAFRYLTTPAGNPHNFSYVLITRHGLTYAVRQQVRIRSHLHEDIAFTPDIVVLRNRASVAALMDPDYAAGKKRFFFASSRDVVAGHECKCLSPFPELYVSFIGTLITGHEWYASGRWFRSRNTVGPHLAPTLFVSGTPSGLHIRMQRALITTLPINIVAGLHRGTWALAERFRMTTIQRRIRIRRAS